MATSRRGEWRPPAVSVVVVTHDNLAVTRLCFAALLAERTGVPFELVVVDNGSTDGTPQFLARLAAQHGAVRVVANGDNRGFAAAVNIGLDVACGDVLILLNNDVIVPPRWLDRLVPLLEEPSVGMVGPVTNAAPNEARVGVGSATYGDFLRVAESRWDTYGRATFDIDVLTMFCLAVPREVVRRVGPLDERFGLGMFEDDDYARRVRAEGYRLVCADGVYVHHFGEASFGALVPTGDHGELIRRNRRLFEAKWGVEWTAHQGRDDSGYRLLVDRGSRGGRRPRAARAEPWSC